METSREKAALGKAAEAPGVRFLPYEGKLVYGLVVVPPWEDGGHIEINLPEHLQYDKQGMGIIRHHDKNPTGRWVVAEDRLSATLEAQSEHIAGASVRGSARAVGGGRVEFSFTIMNNTKIDFPYITALYCHHYRHLTGFPGWEREGRTYQNLEHTWCLMGGKMVKLADTRSETPDALIKAATVKGCDQIDMRFARKYGGVIEEGVDRAISAVSSLDDKRKVILAWTPGKNLLANGYIPCLHAEPYYAPIPVGESATAHGVMLFTEGDLQEAVDTLVAEGQGVPPGKMVSKQ